MSQLKIKNGNTWENIPAGGIGVPSGGTAGQVLTKSSSTDYATEWGTHQHGIQYDVLLSERTISSTGSYDLSASIQNYDYIIFALKSNQDWVYYQIPKPEYNRYRDDGSVYSFGKPVTDSTSWWVNCDVAFTSDTVMKINKFGRSGFGTNKIKVYGCKVV